MTIAKRLSVLAIAAGLIAAPTVMTVISAGSATAAVTAPTTIKINEVESSGGTPGDWIELINNDSATFDLSNYVLKDNDDTHVFTIPSGTVIAAGGYYTADVDVTGGFGLGSADSARLFMPDGTTLVDSYTWTAHAATTYGRCANGIGAFTTTVSSTKGAANDCPTVVAPTTIKVNEVESNGGTPGDWIELINNGSTAFDLSNYLLKDNDNTHIFTIPAGTSIAAGGYYVADVDQASATNTAPFGLGSADSARLFMSDAVTLVDSYSWTAHATTTYGRCPNGTGAFITQTSSTKGAVNDCSTPSGPTTTPPITTPPADPGPTPVAWPGGASTATVDTAGFFGTNLSGLAIEPSGTSAPGVLWAVRNGPSTLYRLLWDGSKWAADTNNGWANGKKLYYSDGTGDPDAEGVTLVNSSSAGGVYVSTERNNSNNGVSRPAVLHFAVTGSGTSINADLDYNMTTDLPAVGPNLGLEAIAWVPDSYLVGKGFYDEHTSALYNPASYPNHGTGLFFTGLEANGSIYAYALASNGTYTRVATIASGFVSIMDLEFEPETQKLWAECDNTCAGRTATLEISAPFTAQPASAGSANQQAAAAGRFGVTQVYERPTGLGDYNNEGFAIAPQSECLNGLKPVIWSDDDNDGGHALRQGTINCTVLAADPTPTPTPTPTGSATPTNSAIPSAAGSGSSSVTQASSLASTGANGEPWFLVGAALVASGAGAVWFARRRPARF